MNSEIISIDKLNDIYNEISDIITNKKNYAQRAVNDAVVSLYWEIGKRLSEEILENQKPEYGKI